MTEFSNEDIERYGRQIILRDIGSSGQEKIKNAKILCLGAGGLGSPAAFYLTAAGAGTIGIVDSDNVDLTNLQRQILHKTSDVGKAKVESAKNTLTELNPNVEIKCFNERLTPKNAREIVKQFDVVIDGCDNFETRYVVNDACFLEEKPVVYGAVFQFEGRATVFSKGGPCYRCVFPKPPKSGSVPSCSQAGVLGAVTGVIGSIQAAEAIKLVIGKGETLQGRLAIYDALTANFSEIKLKKDDSCALCGKQPSITEVKLPQTYKTCIE
ncbi:MAG: ThiF family adenylyltransferase [Candidatus Micrarchaeia archaeon]